MITLQNLIPAHAAAPKAAPQQGSQDLPADPTGFATLLGEQLELLVQTAAPGMGGPLESDEAASIPTTADAAVPIAAAPVAVAVAPAVEAALAMAATLPPPPAVIAPAPQTAGNPFTQTAQPDEAPRARVAQDRSAGLAVAPGAPAPLRAGEHAQAEDVAPLSAASTRPVASPPKESNEPSDSGASASTETKSQPSVPAAPVPRSEPAPLPETRASAAATDATAQLPIPAVAPSTHAVTSAPVHASARVEAPVGSARWAEQLASQVQILVRDATPVAHIQVTPPELGPVRVQISFTDGVASMVLNASAPETREALGAALPALRDALTESGITLGETSVSDERLPGNGERQAAPARGDAMAQELAQPAHAGTRPRTVNLLDVYA